VLARLQSRRHVCDCVQLPGVKAKVFTEDYELKEVRHSLHPHSLTVINNSYIVSNGYGVASAAIQCSHSARGVINRCIGLTVAIGLLAP